MPTIETSWKIFNNFCLTSNKSELSLLVSLLTLAMQRGRCSLPPAVENLVRGGQHP